MSFISLKSKSARRLLTGEPNIVIYNGKIIESELRKLRFNVNDLLSELRLNGCYDISDVEAAIVETSGKLSVIEKSDSRSVTVGDLADGKAKKDGLPFIIVSDGSMNEEELERSGRTVQWLKKQLEKRGIYDLEEVFLLSVNAEGELFIQLKEK